MSNACLYYFIPGDRADACILDPSILRNVLTIPLTPYELSSVPSILYLTAVKLSLLSVPPITIFPSGCIFTQDAYPSGVITIPPTPNPVSKVPS